MGKASGIKGSYQEQKNSELWTVKCNCRAKYNDDVDDVIFYYVVLY